MLSGRMSETKRSAPELLVLVCASGCCLTSATAQASIGLADPGHVPLAESHSLKLLGDQATVSDPRPLAAEPTPFTIEPGRLAIEVDLINFAYDKHNTDGNNERVRALEWPILFRFGVRDDLEVQFGAELYVRESVRDRNAGTRERTDGFGDVFLGAKYNLWGNNGGETALAVLPFATLPTNRHGLTSRAVQGGVLVPFTMELPFDLELDWTPGFSAVRNPNDDGYMFEWSSLGVLNGEVVEDLWWFVEFESIVTSKSGDPWVGTLGAGLTWDMTEDFVIEFGTSAGVTRSADDFGFFITVITRF